MYLIATRSFPPEVGGMQSLMWGLAKEMSKNFMIKVFADYYENHKEFDKEVNFSIASKSSFFASGIISILDSSSLPLY